MSKNMFRLIICLLMLINVTVKAQNTSNSQLYGQGVHAYNIGEYDTALNIFNSAVEQETEDPRVFLFRGLVYHQQGKAKEALADLKKGAELEAVDKRGFYPVSPALIRVQGKVRLQIENLRREARANLVQIEKARAAAASTPRRSACVFQFPASGRQGWHVRPMQFARQPPPRPLRPPPQPTRIAGAPCRPAVHTRWTALAHAILHPCTP